MLTRPLTRPLTEPQYETLKALESLQISSTKWDVKARRFTLFAVGATASSITTILWKCYGAGLARFVTASKAICRVKASTRRGLLLLNSYARAMKRKALLSPTGMPTERKWIGGKVTHHDPTIT